MGTAASYENHHIYSHMYICEENNLYNNTLPITHLPLELLPLINPLQPSHQHLNLFLTCKPLHHLHSLHCLNKPLPGLLIAIPPDLAHCSYSCKPVSQLTCKLLIQNTHWDLHKDQIYIFVRILDANLVEKGRKRCTLLRMTKEAHLFQFHQLRNHFTGKRVEIGLLGVNAFGGKLEWHGEYQLVEAPPPSPPRYQEDYVRCWNGEALVHLFDGSVCPVEELQVGDVLVSATGNPTRVRRIVKSEMHKVHKVVDMGDFYLTRGHPVCIGGEWYRADEVKPAQEVFIRELWNFYAEPEQFVVVGREKVICSCLGGYCGRVAERDVVSDGLFGRGYGSMEAEDYKWLLEARARVPLEMERPFGEYKELIPGREHIKTLLMEQLNQYQH